ncbi:DUF5664 domain-containing protein [bacterium]|nr:DUF5664 domain-containing protein [bacterium]
MDDQPKKFDQDKPRTDLLSPLAMIEEAKVFGFGAKKYGDDNYKKFTAQDIPRYTGALLRHTFAYMRGEVLDTETGLHHMAHIRCCAAIIMELEAAEPSSGYIIPEEILEEHNQPKTTKVTFDAPDENGLAKRRRSQDTGKPNGIW